MSLRAAHRIMLSAAMLFAPAWLRHRRNLYRPAAHPLRPHELAAFRPFFHADVLRDVRIARVEQLKPWPLEGALRRVGFGGLLWSRAVSGIALIDTVVIITPTAREHHVDPLSLLFHELVHIEQYRILGLHGFLREYLGGWLAAGRSYLDIPLEVQAYECGDRFDHNPSDHFSVTEVVQSHFPPRRGV